ncbi:MAG: hypothetical protein LBI79_09190 [Nitrososphaerota archaeon]|jgi:hypothetical protein|nr:hypothetical protein [Nitrososphaerota archaeon]
MQKLITMQKLMPQTTTKLQLTFNMPYIDELFPAFQAGDFAVLYGSQNVTLLMAQLCVRAHLPTKQGGLESNVIFIDAANSSSLPSVLQVAEHQQLEPQKMLEQIQTLRAYTAYRLHTLIIEKLEQAIKASGAKLVVISDIMCPFLTENVDDQEARTAYNQIMNYLSNFAKKHGIIIIATNPLHENNPRNRMLQEITTAKAGVILRYTKTQYTSDIELEKHPSYMLGIVDFRPENKTLTDF